MEIIQNQTSWSIDKTKSDISFSIDPQIFAAVHGSFKNYEAKIFTVGNDFNTIKVNLWIDPLSINTGDHERDEHLKSMDFFDVKNHPQIIFTSERVVLSDLYENHELWGFLTIKGITKEVKMAVMFGGILADAQGTDMAEFFIEGKVNRKDWGLLWNDNEESDSLLGSEDVDISCKVTLVKSN